MGVQRRIRAGVALVIHLAAVAIAVVAFPVLGGTCIVDDDGSCLVGQSADVFTLEVLAPAFLIGSSGAWMLASPALGPRSGRRLLAAITGFSVVAAALVVFNTAVLMDQGFYGGSVVPMYLAVAGAILLGIAPLNTALRSQG